MFLPRAQADTASSTSLAARGGIGDFGSVGLCVCGIFGPPRRRVCGKLLPLGPLGYGNSPYSSLSALRRKIPADQPGAPRRSWLDDRAQIDAPAHRRRPQWITRLAFPPEASFAVFSGAQFSRAPLLPTPALATRSYCRQKPWWLDDFVLFDSLRARFKLESWEPLAPRLTIGARAIEKAARRNARRTSTPRRAVQFFFLRNSGRRSEPIAPNMRSASWGHRRSSVEFRQRPMSWISSRAVSPQLRTRSRGRGRRPSRFFRAKTASGWGNPLYRWT